jgi:dolichol-phosphate mannosyltransferase
LLNCFAQLLLGSRVHDYSSGFVMARREVLRTLPLAGGYGEYCIDFLCRAHRAGYRIAEVPFANVPRRDGQTKTSANPLTFAGHGLTYLRTILRLAWEGRETWTSAAAT